VLDRQWWDQVKHRLALVLLLLMSPEVSASCVDWNRSSRFGDIEHAHLIFEGRVERVERDPRDPCTRERVIFYFTRVWKGRPGPSAVVMQQSLAPNCTVFSEQDAFEQGRTYIVFATESKTSKGTYGSMGCGLSSPPTETTRSRLNEWARATLGKK